MTHHIGVDVGGTFTDLISLAEDGSVMVGKVSTSVDQAEAILVGIDGLGVAPADIEFLAHGTTTATNALITKRGARTVLITTRGFRDILELRRTNKGDLYDLQWTPPKPIIRRADRLEVTERLAYDGRVLVPLAEEEVPTLARIIRKREVQAVAIVLLHGYLNDSHELRLQQLLRAELPDVYICCSSEVLPQYREFERTATVAANAFVAPVMKRYFASLQGSLESRDFTRDVLVMQSNGGLSSISAAAETPAKLVRSGPSAGAVAMQELARTIGKPNLIGLDIGGTSADVGLVVDGRPKLSNRVDVEFGLPIMFPSLDIVSIGAGGGSIARVDAGGSLAVGPDSAGSIPGPACYGKGGIAPTSTDAQVVLGRLASDGLVGGQMTIDPSLSVAAIERFVAEPLGVGVIEAAEGIVRILSDNMMRACRFVTIEKGYDPRDFGLCAFGGAGPMYAVDIARELAIPTVVIPRFPGVFSAYGLLRADIVYDASRTLLIEIADLGEEDAEEIFAGLEGTVLDRFAADHVQRDEVTFRREMEMLFTGQVHALSVPFPSGAFDVAAREALLEHFYAEHRRAYGHAEPGDPVTLVTARVFGERPRPVRELAPADTPTPSSERSTREVHFSGHGFVDTALVPRSSLVPGEALSGPALVTQVDATTILPPGTLTTLTPQGDLLVEVSV